MARALDRPTIESLRVEGNRDAQRATYVLDGPTLGRGQCLTVYVPVDDTRYLFLWRTESFRIADVRALASGNTRNIDHEVLEQMRTSGRDVSRGFPSFIRRAHLEGRALPGEPGLPPVMIVVGSDALRPASPLAIAFMFLGWRTFF